MAETALEIFRESSLRFFERVRPQEMIRRAEHQSGEARFMEVAVHQAVSLPYSLDDVLLLASQPIDVRALIFKAYPTTYDADGYDTIEKSRLQVHGGKLVFKDPDRAVEYPNFTTYFNQGSQPSSHAGQRVDTNITALLAYKLVRGELQDPYRHEPIESFSTLEEIAKKAEILTLSRNVVEAALLRIVQPTFLNGLMADNHVTEAGLSDYFDQVSTWHLKMLVDRYQQGGSPERYFEPISLSMKPEDYPDVRYLEEIAKMFLAGVISIDTMRGESKKSPVTNLVGSKDRLYGNDKGNPGFFERVLQNASVNKLSPESELQGIRARLLDLKNSFNTVIHNYAPGR